MAGLILRENRQVQCKKQGTEVWDTVMQTELCYLHAQVLGSPVAQTKLAPYAGPGEREMAFPILITLKNL